MQKIEVRAYATLLKYMPDLDLAKGKMIDIEDNTSIESLLKLLGIPKEETKIIIVNGVHAELDYIVKENDRVAIFPPVAGGN
ncbi:MAG: MoaD/ThiS family protein [Candidatus Schekmanbacteria bacterium]|nr:MoaD/ThiS family protein [Candidatus Schekmanbacteria bacterium]